MGKKTTFTHQLFFAKIQIVPFALCYTKRLFLEGPQKNAYRKAFFELLVFGEKRRIAKANYIKSLPTSFHLLDFFLLRHKTA
jgi:hypothetical protein